MCIRMSTRLSFSPRVDGLAFVCGFIENSFTTKACWQLVVYVVDMSTSRKHAIKAGILIFMKVNPVVKESGSDRDKGLYRLSS